MSVQRGYCWDCGEGFVIGEGYGEVPDFEVFCNEDCAWSFRMNLVEF